MLLLAEAPPAVRFRAVAFGAVRFRVVAVVAVRFVAVAFFAGTRFDGAVRLAGAAFFVAFAAVPGRFVGLFAAVAPVARRVAVATFFAAVVRLAGAFFAPVALRAAAGRVAVRVLPPRPCAGRRGSLTVDRIGPARRASATSTPPRPAGSTDRSDTAAPPRPGARPWPGARPKRVAGPERGRRTFLVRSVSAARGSCLPLARTA
ncbi:hypothetical protein [Plantactinospora endophytica]|uniref:hypothetical protein n=1 Tax=Plantactinospora endophytica TaxID=673535 RepID=UPI00194547C4|nr:hypothetical protein [Plantactinospora endophytica]